MSQLLFSPTPTKDTLSVPIDVRNYLETPPVTFKNLPDDTNLEERTRSKNDRASILDLSAGATLDLSVDLQKEGIHDATVFTHDQLEPLVKNRDFYLHKDGYFYTLAQEDQNFKEENPQKDKQSDLPVRSTCIQTVPNILVTICP